jgi:hypothetical protein
MHYIALVSDLEYDGVTYQLGLNTDEESRLMYTDLNRCINGLSRATLIAEVENQGDEILDKHSYNTWNTNRLYVHTIRTIPDWFEVQTDEVKNYILDNLNSEKFFGKANLIKLYRHPTEEQKLDAVNTYGCIIEYIDDPSEEVQLAAYKQNQHAICYIKNPTKAVQLSVVKNNIYQIVYLSDPTEEAQLIAVQGNYNLINRIRKPTEAVRALCQKRIAAGEIDEPLYDNYDDYDDYEECYY